MSGRILFVAANPGHTDDLDLDKECDGIERELRSAPHRDFQLISRWAVTVDEMMRHLNELSPTVLHFAGHGIAAGPHGSGSARASRDVAVPTDRVADASGIYLLDERGGPQLVTASALLKMIKAAATSVRVVVLNACYSEDQAQALCGAVDCVIGMAGTLDDEAARSFAVGLYRALGHRRSVGNAFEQAVATLAGKALPGQAIPRCRTRDGVDAGNVFLTVPACHATHQAALPWSQRFEVVIRLSTEARDKLTSDPWGAAMRAQRAIEHVVNYLYERELGPSELDARLDAKLRRVRAKLVIPTTTAGHFDFVQSFTSAIVDGGGIAIEPDHLRPCLDSLAIAVDWFFRDYLKDSRPRIGRDAAAASSDTVPDATPHSTIGTVVNTGTRVGMASGDNIGIWRPSPVASTLRLDAPETAEPGQRIFKIERSDRIYFLGRTAMHTEHRSNDFSIPAAWDSISRNQATIAIRGADVVLTNASSKDNVFVRGELVAAGASRILRHGDVVQIGLSLGAFADGRYYPVAPGSWIDRRTGLLARSGLIAEISNNLRKQERAVLFVIRCPEDIHPQTSAAPRDIERVAVLVATAIHRRDPAIRVGHIGTDVVALLGAQAAVRALADLAREVAGAPCVSGFVVLSGAAGEATARLEACLGALNRIAIGGATNGGPLDLTRHAVTRTQPDAFADQARALYADGGGAILFALGELDRLEQLTPQAIPVLELELVELLGGRMGPRELVSFAGRGALLFGLAGDVEGCAHQVGVLWHAREPVTADGVEIGRSLSAHLLAVSDLDHLDQRVAALASGDAVFGASGLPAPLALAARAINDTRDPIERARALVALADLTWRWLGIVLVAIARSIDVRAETCDGACEASWPAPWRSLAHHAARTLEGRDPRFRELAAIATSFDSDKPLHTTMDFIVGTVPRVTASRDVAETERLLPRLERAIRELLAALGPLRGWTLIAVTSSEFVDVGGTSQCIEYVDYTGPSARGSHQRVTLSGYPGLGRFIYLVRWSEGIAIALEPYARRARNEISGDHELFLAIEPILKPGSHRYRALASGHEVVLQATAKQLGERR
jgi:pSer/pThr/pTyr-binding forkhead associated (FHA) protein